ncbi:c-type cytochrome, partial [Ralstonia pseudosolanacearum]|uniref:c-type cytochrome n=1 Tax=Ralstonia pseudosolanacearum TaxID=1310165 RepID=UPI003CED8E7D
RRCCSPGDRRRLQLLTSSSRPTSAGDIGKKVYDSTCQMCHAAGVAGAPKFGDKAAWAPRIAEGKAKMYDIALHGKGAMPPKGTYAGSDDDVKAAVDFMAAAAK